MGCCTGDEKTYGCCAVPKDSCKGRAAQVVSIIGQIVALITLIVNLYYWTWYFAMWFFVFGLPGVAIGIWFCYAAMLVAIVAYSMATCCCTGERGWQCSSAILIVASCLYLVTIAGLAVSHGRLDEMIDKHCDDDDDTDCDDASDTLHGVFGIMYGWVFFVETHLCTDSRADSRLNHGEVDFEWFARLRRKCFVSKSLNLNINRGRLWSAFIRQMILSDVNVPKIGESDLRDIVVGSVELKPYDFTYYHGYTQQRGMLRLEVVFNDDLTVGISSEIKDEICSKLESAVQALKSRISRICGINELERRTRRTRI